MGRAVVGAAVFSDWPVTRLDRESKLAVADHLSLATPDALAGFLFAEEVIRNVESPPTRTVRFAFGDPSPRPGIGSRRGRGGEDHTGLTA